MTDVEKPHRTGITKDEDALAGLENHPEVVDGLNQLKAMFPEAQPRQAFKDHLKNLPIQITATRARIRWAAVEYQLAQNKYRDYVIRQNKQDGALMSQMAALLRGAQDAPAPSEDEMVRTIIGQRCVDDELSRVRKRIDALDAMIKGGYRVLYKAMEAYRGLVAIQRKNTKRNVRFQNNMRVFIESMKLELSNS